MSLPIPGSQAYLPNLLNHLESSPTLGGYKPDPTLFSILLLATIVRKGGVLIDVEHETTSKSDRKGKGREEFKQGELDKVVGNVLAICRGIFGWRTHTLHLHAGMDPNDIPELILSNPNAGFRDKHKSESNRRREATRSRTTSSQGAPAHHPTRTDSYKGEVPDVLLVTGMEDSESPTRIKLVDILTTRTVKAGCNQLSEGLIMICVRRGGKGTMPGWVLDQFAISTHVYPADMAQALNLAINSLIPESYLETLRSLLPHTHIHPPLLTRISNLLSAVSLHPFLKSTITAKTISLFPAFVRAHRLLSAPFELPSGLSSLAKPSWAEIAGEEPTLREEDEGWYARIENVEGVFMTCLRHRVRARGERGEIMWLLEGSAVDSQGLGAGSKAELGRRRVDGILEGILLSV